MIAALVIALALTVIVVVVIFTHRARHNTPPSLDRVEDEFENRWKSAAAPDDWELR